MNYVIVDGADWWIFKAVVGVKKQTNKKKPNNFKTFLVLFS